MAHCSPPKVSQSVSGNTEEDILVKTSVFTHSAALGDDKAGREPFNKANASPISRSSQPATGPALRPTEKEPGPGAQPVPVGDGARHGPARRQQCFLLRSRAVAMEELCLATTEKVGRPYLPRSSSGSSCRCMYGRSSVSTRRATPRSLASSVRPDWDEALYTKHYRLLAVDLVYIASSH